MEEEQHLSQRLSQLSTHRTEKNQCLLEEIQCDIEKIPDYLTKRNESFKTMIHQTLSIVKTVENSYKSINIDEWRKIALLIYKMKIIQNYHRLWTIHFKSGTGQLMNLSNSKLKYSSTASIWPKEIKSLPQFINDNRKDKHHLYLTYVHNQLHALNQCLEQVQNELHLKINHFQNNSSIIQKSLETYIEENFSSFHRSIEHQIELIDCNYHIQAIKLEYYRYEPNEYQIKVMKDICQSKYEQETTEQEYQLLKKQLNYYHQSNQSFESFSLCHSPSIDSIQELTVRKDLFEQFKNIAEQSRTNLFNLYLKTAEEQKIIYRKKYDDHLKKMFLSQKSMNDKEKVSSIMMQLIDERCQKINERIQCIFKYKTDLFFSKSS